MGESQSPIFSCHLLIKNVLSQKKLIKICSIKNKYLNLYVFLVGFIMRTANFTELRSNLKEFLDQVISNSEPLLVSRPHNESVVVISLEEYNALKETEYIMRQPELMESLMAAERDVEYGKTYTQAQDESVEDFLNRMACTE